MLELVLINKTRTTPEKPNIRQVPSKMESKKMNSWVLTREITIIIGSIVFFIFSLLDGVLTLWVLRLGAIEEVNPMMRWLINKSPIGFMAFKLTLPVMLAFVLWRIRNNAHKFVINSLWLVLVAMQ